MKRERVCRSCDMSSRAGGVFFLLRKMKEKRCGESDALNGPWRHIHDCASPLK